MGRRGFETQCGGGIEKASEPARFIDPQGLYARFQGPTVSQSTPVFTRREKGRSRIVTGGRQLDEFPRSGARAWDHRPTCPADQVGEGDQGPIGEVGSRTIGVNWRSTLQLRALEPIDSFGRLVDRRRKNERTKRGVFDDRMAIEMRWAVGDFTPRRKVTMAGYSRGARSPLASRDPKTTHSSLFDSTTHAWPHYLMAGKWY